MIRYLMRLWKWNLGHLYSKDPILLKPDQGVMNASKGCRSSLADTDQDWGRAFESVSELWVGDTWVGPRNHSRIRPFWADPAGKRRAAMAGWASWQTWWTRLPRLNSAIGSLLETTYPKQFHNNSYIYWSHTSYITMSKILTNNN